LALPRIIGFEFPCKALPCQTATGGLSHSLNKAVAIVLASHIVAIGLLVQVTKQMERFDTYVGSVKPALQEAPEILHRVCMDNTFDVGDRVIDDLVRILTFKTIVGKQFIGVERRPRFDSAPDFRLQRVLFPILDNNGLDFTAALHETRPRRFYPSRRFQ